MGRYELILTCNDEEWATSLLTNIALMTFETAFDHGHTMDILPWLDDPKFPVQGVIFEEFSSSQIDGGRFGIFRVHGVSRIELDVAREKGSNAVLMRRKKQGRYPFTFAREGRVANA